MRQFLCDEWGLDGETYILQEEYSFVVTEKPTGNWRRA